MHISDFTENGRYSLRKIAVVLRTSPEEVTMTAGLNKDARGHTEAQSDTAQGRLRDMAVVLEKLTPRFGSPLMAYAWYRSEPLPGLGRRTAMELVQEGNAQQVLEYIESVAAGVFA